MNSTIASWKDVLNSDPESFLLEGEPWARYNTLTSLLDKPEDEPEVKEARADLVQHPLIQDLMSRLSVWFDSSVTRHNDPKLPPHILKALADMGIRAGDPGMAEIIGRIEAHRAGSLYTTRQTLPDKSNQKPNPNADEWHALPCDSPEITSTLMQMGHSSPGLNESTREILARWRAPEDWFCHFFFVDGQYKKNQVGCPMAGLMVLDLFSRIDTQSSEQPDSDLVKRAFEPLVYHRDLGKSLYYFGRSKKFWTFKFPFVWYNALYLADVLTRFAEFHETPLVNELMQWIIEGQDDDGRWKATSMFKTFKGFDFAQKKEPSGWITFLCCKILKQRWSLYRTH